MRTPKEVRASPRRSSRVLDVDVALSLVSQGVLEFDAIIVLGGGPPITERLPMPFVEARCDAARRLFEASSAQPKVLCVSAGTAHARQVIRDDGLPVWESTAAAAYLIDSGVPEMALVVETTSYDTIGNAFFTRTSHTDIADWRRLCIITSDFHVSRSKAIFEWVFAGAHYELTFVETPAIGLTEDAVEARIRSETKSLETVHKLSVAYPTLRDIHTFLTTHHDLYTANKLAEHKVGAIEVASLSSYGGVSPLSDDK